MLRPVTTEVFDLRTERVADPDALCAPRNQPSGAIRASDLDGSARAILNQLRLTALECRTAARTDLSAACACATRDKSADEQPCLREFIKCLPQALGKRPKLLRPGVSEVSFDEAWILRLIAASQDQDGDSLAFLLRSRVVPEARSQVGSLLEILSGRDAPHRRVSRA